MSVQPKWKDGWQILFFTFTFSFLLLSNLGEKYSPGSKHAQKVKRGEVILQSDFTVCTMKVWTAQQLANYQRRPVKAAGKSSNMRRRTVHTSARIGRQSVRRFSMMENRLLSTGLLKLHHVLLIILCTDSDTFNVPSDFTQHLCRSLIMKKSEFCQTQRSYHMKWYLWIHQILSKARKVQWPC